MGTIPLIIQPDPDEAEAAELFVEGLLDGMPYRFLLDTGAAKTRVLWDLYTSSFESVGQHFSSGVFAGSSNEVITIPRIEVGPIAANDFTVVRVNGDTQGMTHLIGMDLLQAYHCHFLFDENRVVVDGDDPSDPAYPFQSLLTDEKFHPYVKMHFGPSPANAVWDTGASITIVDMAFVQKHPDLFLEVGGSTGTDSTGASMDTPMYIMAPTRIGEMLFPYHRVAGVDLSQVNSMIDIPMDLILGYSTLRHANWLFDFPRKRWAITKQLAML